MMRICLSIRRLMVSCVVVAASATACNRGPDKDDKPAATSKTPAAASRTAAGDPIVRIAADAQPRIGLQTQVATAHTIEPEVVAFGRLEEDPSQTFVLRAPVAGTLHFAIGRDWPNIGQALADGAAGLPDDDSTPEAEEALEDEGLGPKRRTHLQPQSDAGILPHALAVLDLTSGGMSRIAQYLGYSGSYRAARDLFRVIADAYGESDAYGPEHRDTLSARSELARWTGAVGHRPRSDAGRMDRHRRHPRSGGRPRLRPLGGRDVPGAENEGPCVAGGR